MNRQEIETIHQAKKLGYELNRLKNDFTKTRKESYGNFEKMERRLNIIVKKIMRFVDSKWDLDMRAKEEKIKEPL